MGWKTDVNVYTGAATGAVFLAPVVVTAVGFGATGVAANSAAASMMSWMGTGSLSVVPLLQSIGATGTVLSSNPATAVSATAGAAAFKVGKVTAKIFRK